MGDLDFDELDKAVTGAMQDDSTVNESGSVGSSDASTTINNGGRGRFMDIVHPSSDMSNQRQPMNQGYKVIPDVQPQTEEVVTQTEEISANDAAELDRITESIQNELPGDGVEIKEPIVAEPAEETIVATESVTVPELSNNPEVEIKSSVLDTDPVVDLTDTSVEQTPADVENKIASIEEAAQAPTPEAPADLQAANDEVATSEDASVEEVGSDVEPISTPFLPDAKVEKRPLGSIDSVGQSGVDEVQSSTSGFDPSAINENETQSIYDQEPVAQATVVKPKKKAGGWIWLLIILLIVLVGAGGGALLYLLVF